MRQLLRVPRVDGLEVPSHDGLVQSLHVLSLEGRLQGRHLVNYAAQGPDVRFHVVGLVLPHLGARIIWCAGLSVQESIFGHFRDVEIA